MAVRLRGVGRGAILLQDGDRFTVGNISIQALHTPGHTPEHLIFLVTDGAAATEPIAAVTGDFVFVGDVGRPDLLERAAGVGGTMDAAAQTLFHSLQRFKLQPDWISSEASQSSNSVEAGRAPLWPRLSTVLTSPCPK